MCDMPEFMNVSEHTRSARGKPRKCEECSGIIEPGTRYTLISGKWDGQCLSFYIHELCWKICEAQRAELIKDGAACADEFPAFGEMVEIAAEDASAADSFPPYWPPGVYISRKALATWVKQNTG